jgi:hypothetical protein
MTEKGGAELEEIGWDFESALVNRDGLIESVALCGWIEDNVSFPMVQFSWETTENSLRYDENGIEDGMFWGWVALKWKK